MTGTLLANSERHVSLSTTLLFTCLLVGLVLSLAFEEQLHAKKSVIAGTFAIICLLLGAMFEILPFEHVVIGSHEAQLHSVIDGTYVDDETGVHEFHIPATTPAPSSDAGNLASASTPTSQDADQTPPDVAADEAPPDMHVGGHSISMPVYIPAIDWGVIAIILGSSLFVDITSKSGLFTWIAIRLTKLSRGDPLKLLATYGVMTVVFSAVLNNVTAMIIVGSLTAVSLDKLKRTEQLLGFLIVEGLLTNVGGLLTLISSVPNIIVGTAAGISFATFFTRAAPYVVVATIATIWLAARVFGVRRLTTREQREEAAGLVAGFDENDGIESNQFFWCGAIMLALFIFTIALTSELPYIQDLQMGFVALAFAGVMLLRYKSTADQFYRALDWDLLGFFMALFVVINVMEHAMVLELIGAGLEKMIGDGTTALGSGLLLISSAAFSSVTDNIPLAAMLAKILSAPRLGLTSASPLWWSVVFGANLGGNITPIGSASTLVAVTIIHKHNISLSFAGFVKLAWPFALMQLGLATVYVLIFLR